MWVLTGLVTFEACCIEGLGEEVHEQALSKDAILQREEQSGEGQLRTCSNR